MAPTVAKNAVVPPTLVFQMVGFYKKGIHATANWRPTLWHRRATWGH
jgi:hypothetical protein